MRPTTPIHMGILNNNFDLVQEMVVNRFTTWHSIKVSRSGKNTPP